VGGFDWCRVLKGPILSRTRRFKPKTETKPVFRSGMSTLLFSIPITETYVQQVADDVNLAKISLDLPFPVLLGSIVVQSLTTANLRILSVAGRRHADASFRELGRMDQHSGVVSQERIITSGVAQNLRSVLCSLLRSQLHPRLLFSSPCCLHPSYPCLFFS
jgi:hypothetical protein